MRAELDIANAMADLRKRRVILEDYCLQCLRVKDRHGVQDAQSDLRELEAALEALEFAMGQRESLRY